MMKRITGWLRASLSGHRKTASGGMEGVNPPSSNRTRRRGRRGGAPQEGASLRGFWPRSNASQEIPSSEENYEVSRRGRVGFVNTLIGWFRTSLSRQLSVILLVMGVLILVSASVLISSYFNNSLMSSIESVETDYLLMQAENVDAQIRGYRHVVFTDILDSSFHSLIEHYANIEDSERVAAWAALRNQLGDFAQTPDGIGATLVTSDGEMVFYSRLKSETKDLGWFSEMFGVHYNQYLDELVERAKETRNIVMSLKPSKYVQTGTQLLHLACPVLDMRSGHMYGVFVLSLNTRTLNEMANPADGSDAHRESSYAIITDRDGVIIAHPQSSEIGRTLYIKQDGNVPEGDFSVVRRQDQLIHQPLKRMGLQMYRVIDRDKLISEPMRYTLSMVAILAVIVILTILLMVLILRRMMRSVYALQKGLQTVDGGELDVYVATEDENEIGHIIHSFNDMTQRLKFSDEQREIKEREAIHALNHQRIAEIKALENQINSHFLYNTLNSINFTALAGGNLDVSRQIKHLSLMLRYTFERSDGIVTSEQEADWLCQYLALQKLRFGDAFDFTIHVDDDVRHWPMRKLLLQPFVENSILHGLQGVEHGGLIQIQFEMHDDARMRITIEDNGHGMTPEKSQKVSKMLRGNALPEDEDGIGLENAYLRIRSYYGGNARVLIRSWQDIGTKVVLLLPAYEGEAEQPFISPMDEKTPE